MPKPIYDVDETEKGRFSVQGRENTNATRVDLTENQAYTLAHHLVGRIGYVVWRDLGGRFERCPCSRCKRH
jgi:hypothetical protein